MAFVGLSSWATEWRRRSGIAVFVFGLSDFELTRVCHHTGSSQQLTCSLADLPLISYTPVSSLPSSFSTPLSWLVFSHARPYQLFGLRPGQPPPHSTAVPRTTSPPALHAHLKSHICLLEP